MYVCRPPLSGVAVRPAAPRAAARAPPRCAAPAVRHACFSRTWGWSRSGQDRPERPALFPARGGGPVVPFLGPGARTCSPHARGWAQHGEPGWSVCYLWVSGASVGRHAAIAELDPERYATLRSSRPPGRRSLSTGSFDPAGRSCPACFAPVPGARCPAGSAGSAGLMEELEHLAGEAGVEGNQQAAREVGVFLRFVVG